MTANTPETKTHDRRPLLTVNEVAAALNVSTRTVRRMIADGELASRKIRGVRRIRAEELDRYRS